MSWRSLFGGWPLGGFGAGWVAVVVGGGGGGGENLRRMRGRHTGDNADPKSNTL